MRKNRMSVRPWLAVVLSVWLAILALTVPSSVHAQTGAPSRSQVYYVAKTGSDTNPGTEALPWLTVGKAASTVQAGETVYIKSGTYNERVVPLNSGSSRGYITFAAAPGEAVIIDGTGIAVDNFQGLFDLTGKGYIRVSRLTVQNSSGSGIFAESANHLVIEQNHTLHSGSSGIGMWYSSEILVDGNDVENSNYGGAQEALSLGGTGPFEVKNNKVHNPAADRRQALKEGIDIKQGSHDGSVHHNEVYDTQKVALYVDAYDTYTYNIEVYDNLVHDVRMGITLASEAGGLLQNVTVYNNVIWNVYYAGIRTFGQVETPSHPMENITYINNTVYNADPGINVSNDQITNFVVRNNLVTVRRNPFDLNANVMADHNLATGMRDKVYVDAAAFDFHLASGSPAIDAGSPDLAPADDFDGTARPQGTADDIGAYEYH